jgi:hypothetical protein
MADLQAKLNELVGRSWQALDSYRSDIVLVGGLATSYYPRHPDFSPPPMSSRVTVDVDVAIPDPTRIRGNRTIPAALHAGRLVEFVTTDAAGHPVEVCFQMEEDGTRSRADVHLEFLVPLQGRDATSPGTPQPALIAHALRYVDLLLYKPVVIEEGALGRIQLPHPASFIFQKQCIRRDRQAKGKAATDQADVVFTIWGFRRGWDDLADRWRELERTNSEWAAWSRRTKEQMARLYDSADAPGSQEVREVFASQPGITVSAEDVSRVVQAFLGRLGS